jgi:hypothetical protein
VDFLESAFGEIRKATVKLAEEGFLFQGHIHGVTTFLPSRPKPEEVLYIGLTDARILCMLSRALRGSADGR